MVWGRRDDQFPEHPKIWGLSDGAYRLHDAGMCKSAGLLMNGKVMDSRVPGLIPSYKPKYLSELEAAGLWHAPGHDCGKCEQPPAGHHIIHDFLEYHPSREKVEADRAEATERKKKWRESRGASQRDNQRDGRRDGQRPRQGESQVPRPDPARPEGSRAGVSEEPSANDGPPAPSVGGPRDTKLPGDQVERNVTAIHSIRDRLRAEKEAS